MIINSTTLVQMCAKYAALSTNQAGLSTGDFLQLANLVMTSLTAELLDAREEYLIYQESIPVTAGKNSVRVPYRAINGGVRHLWWEDGTGARIRLYPSALESIEDYSTTTTGTPSKFYMQGNSIVLLPTPIASGTLGCAYAFRPNLLVDGTTCQTITGVSGNTVTVPNIPSNFVNGGLYDIIDHTSGNGILAYDQVGTISGSTLTFPALPSSVVVGNYIAQANQSPVPMLPEEGHGLLLEQTVMRLEIIRGNAPRIKAAGQLVGDARKAWEALLSNRVISKAHPAGSGGAQAPLRPW